METNKFSSLRLLAFDYRVIRKPYRRSASIYVTHDNRISITAPSSLSESRIEEILRRKSAWILKRIRLNQERSLRFKRREYRSGEVFFCLGETYVLEIVDGQKGPCQKQNGKLRVFIPSHLNEAERKEHAVWRLTEFCRETADRIFRERVAFYANGILPKPKAIKIRTFNSQWGSASRKGILSFNWKLVMAPLSVLDYVVVHELVHLLHPNHSVHFWNQVVQIFPDYKKSRKWLRENGNILSVELLPL